jgi:anti-sigma factor RsiW
MMLCGQERDTLAAYLDGEMQADKASALEQHLRTCTQCAAEVATMVSMRRALKPARTRFAPSADFRQKIQSQIAPKRRGFRPFAGWTVAFATLAILLAALVWTRQSALRSDAFREVADLHVSDLASSNPYDVISSDRHTVKPWFQGRIPFAFNLPEFAGSEFTLLGGRLVYLHQQPAAQIVVGLRQHKISVLIVQESSGSMGPFAFPGGPDVRNSFNVQTFTSHGLRYFVIGDAEKAAIQRLVQTLQKAND